MTLNDSLTWERILNRKVTSSEVHFRRIILEEGGVKGETEMLGSYCNKWAVVIIHHFYLTGSKADVLGLRIHRTWWLKCENNRIFKMAVIIKRSLSPSLGGTTGGGTDRRRKEEDDEFSLKGHSHLEVEHLKPWGGNEVILHGNVQEKVWRDQRWNSRGYLRANWKRNLRLRPKRNIRERRGELSRIDICHRRQGRGFLQLEAYLTMPDIVEWGG